MKLKANNVAVVHTELPGPIQEELHKDGEEEDKEDNNDDIDNNNGNGDEDNNKDNNIRDDQDGGNKEPEEIGVNIDSSKSHDTIPVL